MWNYEKKKSIQTTLSEEFLVGRKFSSPDALNELPRCKHTRYRFRSKSDQRFDAGPRQAHACSSFVRCKHRGIYPNSIQIVLTKSDLFFWLKQCIDSIFFINNKQIIFITSKRHYIFRSIDNFNWYIFKKKLFFH